MSQLSTASVAAERRFLSLSTWIRERGDDAQGAVSIVEHVLPPGFASPWHVHHHGTETFYVVQGRVTVMVGERTVVLNAGDSVFGPPGAPHGFKVGDDGPARLLLINNRAAFSDFIEENSVEAEGCTPAEPDIPALVASAQRYDMAVLGPLPR